MHIEVQQGSPEWFKARSGRITSSAVGAILGLDPFTTRAQVLRRMVRQKFGLPSEYTENPATQWGKANEAGAITEYVLMTGNRIRECGFFTKGDRHGSSPDRMVGNDGILEVKCPYGKRNDPKPVNFKSCLEQPHYFAQVQHQMWCSETNWADFFQWTIEDSRLERVQYDGTYVTWMLAELDKFWAEYEEALKDPAEHLEDLLPEIDSPNAARMVREYLELEDAIDRATERKKALLEEIVVAAGSRDCIFGGRKLKLVKRAGSVSYSKAVAELLPNADLSKWTGKPVSFWTLK